MKRLSLNIVLPQPKINPTMCAMAVVKPSPPANFQNPERIRNRPRSVLVPADARIKDRRFVKKAL